MTERATRRTLSSSRVQCVAITGGTHGNETNGVYLAKHFMARPDLVDRPSFETVLHLANTHAIKANTRYVDTDMNRCFMLKDLADDTLVDREQARAKELDAMLGPKASMQPKADLIIDLHNTTANTGVALMMAPDDDFAHEIGAHLMKTHPEAGVRVVEWAPAADYAMLPSIGRSGMTFEVGACPWGCLIGKWYALSRQLVLAALDFVEEHNRAVAACEAAGAAPFPMIARPCPVFRRVVNIDYPRDDAGEIAAMVHPAMQDRDFEPIAEGQDLFLMLDGSARPFSAAEHDWDRAARGEPRGLFINEAAYYEKGVALMLTEQLDVGVQVLAAKAQQ
eukprot:g3549.t1